MKSQNNVSVLWKEYPCVLFAYALSLFFLVPFTQKCAAETFPGKVSQFHSFPRYDFEHGGRRCIVVTPRVTADGNPWIWRARFLLENEWISLHFFMRDKVWGGSGTTYWISSYMLALRATCSIESYMLALSYMLTP